MSSSSDATPTSRQLSYLRALAARTATTFAYPATRRQASQQIERLAKLGGARDASPAPDVEHLSYATAVDPEEVVGFGSCATWRSSSPPRGQAATRGPRMGQRTVLARYTLASGERVLDRQEVDGRLRIVDRPGSGDARSYLVERELPPEGLDSLGALIADYLSQARELDEVPMASGHVRQLLGSV